MGENIPNITVDNHFDPIASYIIGKLCFWGIQNLVWSRFLTSSEFSGRNFPDNSRETRFYNKIILWKPKKTAQTDGLLQHFDILTIEKSESLFKGAASFLFADLTASQLFLLILASYLGNEKSEI